MYSLHPALAYLPEIDAPLQPGDIDLWQLRVSHWTAQLEVLRPLLGEAELSRAARYRMQDTSQRFTIGRAALRLILSAYQGTPFSGLEFLEGGCGKPELAAPGDPPLHFNLSHSADLILIAISLGAPVGIDVQLIDESVDWRALTRKVCTDAECAVLESLAEADARDRFFRAWCRKEAYVKAIGAGFFQPLSGCEVALAPDEPPRFLDLPGGRAEIARWSLYDLSSAPGYAAALVASPGARLRDSRELRSSV